MAMMNGVMRGSVIDSIDPGRKGRVKVRLAAMPGGDSYWSSSCVRDLRIGDTVIVAFESGDPNQAVVIGKLTG